MWFLCPHHLNTPRPNLLLEKIIRQMAEREKMCYLYTALILLNTRLRLGPGPIAADSVGPTERLA